MRRLLPVLCVESERMMRGLLPFFVRIRLKPLRRLPSSLPHMLPFLLLFRPFLLFRVCSLFPGLSLILPKMRAGKVRTIPVSLFDKKVAESGEYSRNPGKTGSKEEGEWWCFSPF